MHGDLHAFTAALEPLRLANKVPRKNLYEWKVASADGRATQSSSGVEFSTHAIEEVSSDCDMMLVCAGELPKTSLPSTLPHILRKTWRSGEVVGGLYTGAYALAEAGILADAEFTLHWDDQEAFMAEYQSLMP